jgi:tetratricopeptide (TPR) repeat protein
MTRVSFFKSNPAFLTQQKLRESFVVRQVDLELVLERIRENTGPSSQHLLIIGTRGMGKTTLVLRVETEIVENAALAQQWYPIRFSEESYEVSSAAEFWLEALGHLATQTGLERWKEAHRALREERDDQRLFDRALARLLDYADEIGKRLLLIVENLNMLLGSQLSDDDAWSLRHTLLNERRIVLLATATARFSEVDDSEKPFYDLFWVHELEPLDTDECRALWKAVSGVEEAGHRIRPIQILTGGNPRLLAILASFASQGSLRTLISDLEYWVDDHTSYFKANVEQLPTKERKVYVTLANLWHPATSREVADMARLKVNEVSALLNRLRQRGAVTEQRSGRTVRYQVAERMYNIYYLMRQHSSHGDRVRAVVEFMILYYERDEIARTVAAIGEEACSLAPDERTDHFFVYAGVLQRHPDALRREAIRATRPEFFELKEAPPVIKALLDAVQTSGGEHKPETMDLDMLMTLLQQDPNDSKLFEHIIEALQARPEQVRAADDMLASRLRRVQPSQWQGWNGLGLVLLVLEDHEGAAHAIRESLRLHPEQGGLWVVLGLILDRSVGDAEGAVRAYRAALELDPLDLQVLKMLVDRVEKSGRGALLAQVESKVLAYEADSVEQWEVRANILSQLHNTQEAARSYRAALELAPDRDDLWASLGDVLSHDFTQRDNAEYAYRKAIELRPDGFYHWVRLGGYFAWKRSNLSEAEAAFRRSIQLRPDSPFAWEWLGAVLMDAGHLEKAIECLRKSIELDPSSSYAWGDLADALIESAPAESLRAYIKAFEYASEYSTEYSIGWVGLSRLFQSNAADALEPAVRKLLETHDSSAWAWGILGRFLQLNRRDNRSALAAYRKAVTMEPLIPFVVECVVEVSVRVSGKDEVSKADAAEEIRRAVTRAQADPAVLYSAARGIYKTAWRQLYADAEQWGRAALAIRPRDFPMQKLLTSILLETGQVADALTLGGELLSGLAYERQLPLVSDFFVRVAAAGHAREALAILSESKHRGMFEPLLVALQMAVGEECHAPQEVSEIAHDILLEIAALKEACLQPAT